MQTDFFPAGETHSIPPHFDPARVDRVEVVPVIDRDHVGADEVGRFGNDAKVYCVRIIAKNDEVLHADTRETYNQASGLSAAWLQRINLNRQKTLF